jgi:hypothetical protein
VVALVVFDPGEVSAAWLDFWSSGYNANSVPRGLFQHFKRQMAALRSLNQIHSLQAKGERVYRRLRPRLEPRYKGQILAIEVESGQYVVGKDELQVALKAMNKFPGKKFTFFRVGYPAVHKLRHRECLQVG